MNEPDPAVPAPPAAPTPADLEARRVRTDKATRRALAALLILEALIVLLVPRAIARTDVGLGTGRTVLLVAFAVLLVAAGGFLRRSWGIGFGTVLQVAVLALGFWESAMFVLGIIFAVIWLYVLNLRHDLVGTPGGWRFLVS